MKKLIAIFVLSFAATALAQSPSGIIAASRYPGNAWQSAGDQAAIPTTTCASVSPRGSGLDDGPDINAAITSAGCASGGVVLLSAGTFTLATEVTDSVSGVWVSGNDASTTKVVASSALAATPFTTGNTSTTTASWSSGFTQGTTSIQLSVAPAVGNILELSGCTSGWAWNGTNCSSSGFTLDPGLTAFWCETMNFMCNYNGANGDLHWQGLPTQRQFVYVTAVSGAGPYTVTITPGLFDNWTSGSVYALIIPVETNVGFENFSLDVTGITSGAVNAAVNIANCYNCGIEGLRVVAASEPPDELLSASYADQWTIRNNLVDGDANWLANKHSGAAIAIDGSPVGNGLIENNAFFMGDIYLGVSMENVVIAYNAAPWHEEGGYTVFGHQGGIAWTLDEGNEVGQIATCDAVHGGGAFMTLFRNVETGISYGYNNPVGVATPPAVYNGTGCRFINEIGDVLGTPSLYTTYEHTPADTNASSVYVHGFSNKGEYFPYDALPQQTMFRWGNYDTYNAAVQWNSAQVPSALDQAIGYRQQIGTGNASTTTFTATLANLPCIDGDVIVYDANYAVVSGAWTASTYFAYERQGSFAETVAGANGMSGGTQVGTITGTMNCTTGALSVTFPTAPPSGDLIYAYYQQQSSTASAYQNPVPASHALPLSFFITGLNSEAAGTPGSGLPFRKVCVAWSSFPTCSSYELNPFPFSGPDVAGGTGEGAGGYSYNIPAWTALTHLPIDTSYQQSFALSGITCSAGVATATFTTANSAGLQGPFQLTGASPAGFNSSASTSPDAEWFPTDSANATVTWTIGTCPAASATTAGTLLFPDYRLYTSATFENDPAATFVGHHAIWPLVADGVGARGARSGQMQGALGATKQGGTVYGRPIYGRPVVARGARPGRMQSAPTK